MSLRSVVKFVVLRMASRVFLLTQRQVNGVRALLEMVVRPLNGNYWLQGRKRPQSRGADHSVPEIKEVDILSGKAGTIRLQ